MKGNAIWMVALVLPLCLEGARILAFFPFPGWSHHRVFQPLVRELAERGHHLTYVTPFTLENPPSNLQEIIIPDIMKDLKGGLKNFLNMNPFQGALFMFSMGPMIQERLGKIKAIRDLIESEDLNFDVVMSSSSMLQEPTVALQHKFGAVGIEVVPIGNSQWLNEVFGNPNNPSYIVDFKSPFSDRMDFYQRVLNTLMNMLHYFFGHLYYIPRMQKVMDKYYNYTGWETRPPILDMMANKSLVLLNSHVSVGYAYPLSPHVIEVSGLGIVKTTPLPKDIKNFMDEAKDGVIILSFGSNIEMSDIMKGQLFSSFVGALGRLKQRIIWKWESEDFPGKPGNVKPVKWLPQQDILAHKNCRLFITHCGFSSIVETIYYGVPIVGIPLFGDQMKNMKQASSAGFGIEIGFNNISEESISWAVNEALNNPSYRKAALERAEIFRDRPMPAMDTAIYWIEYVIKYRGAPHLRTYLSSLKWYQSSLLDVAVTLASVLTLALLLFYYVLRCLGRIVCRRKLKKPEPKSKRKGD